MNLKPTANSIDAYPRIAVEDNDRIVIPHLPSTVSVVGMVYNSGSFVYNPRRRVGDYLRMAGTGKPHADMHHAFVLRADGTVVPASRSTACLRATGLRLCACIRGPDRGADQDSNRRLCPRSA